MPTTPTMPTVPVIDVSAAIAGQGIGAVAHQINRACRKIGFFQIVGHGVDLALVDAVYRTAPDLWGLPAEVKDRYRSPTNHAFQGWCSIDDSNGLPLQERWQINRFDSSSAAIAAGVPEHLSDRFRPNIWPDAAPEFIAASKACFEATRALGGRVMALFAVALGLDDGFFEPMLRTDSSYFAVNHYPGVSRMDPGDTALSEHTDSGTLTLLHQRGDYEGLQVRMRSGELYRMPIIDEAFIVNIGELMARWTNDRWVATPHDVVMGEPGQSRTSITTFHTPAVETVVEPLATCVNEDGPLYDPVTVYQWESMFIAKTYA